MNKPPFANRLHETECLAGHSHVSWGERWHDQFSIDASVWSPCPCMERKLTSQPVFVVPFSAKQIMLGMFDWRHSTENLNIVLLSCSSVLPPDKWHLDQFNYSLDLKMFLFHRSFSIKLQPSLVLLRRRTSKYYIDKTTIATFQKERHAKICQKPSRLPLVYNTSPGLEPSQPYQNWWESKGTPPNPRENNALLKDYKMLLTIIVPLRIP